MRWRALRRPLDEGCLPPAPGPGCRRPFHGRRRRRPAAGAGRSRPRLLHLAWVLILAAACAPSPDELVAQLGSRDPGELKRVTDLLLRHDGDVTSALRRALGTEDWRIRYMCAQLLGTLRARAAVGDLVVALSDGNAGVVERSATSLGLIADPAAVPALVAALSHPSPDVALAAAGALERIGSAAAVPGLLAHAEDPSPRLRARVLQAFGTCVDTTQNEIAEAVYLRLTAGLEDSSPSMRVAAIAGLRGFAYRGLGTWLLAAAEEEVPEVTYVAVQALGEIAGDAHPAWQGASVPGGRLVATLMRVARQTTVPAVRGKALRSLGQLRAASAVPFLDSLTAHGTPADRRAAGRALRAIAGEGW